MVSPDVTFGVDGILHVSLWVVLGVAALVMGYFLNQVQSVPPHEVSLGARRSSLCVIAVVGVLALLFLGTDATFGIGAVQLPLSMWFGAIGIAFLWNWVDDSTDSHTNIEQ